MTRVNTYFQRGQIESETEITQIPYESSPRRGTGEGWAGAGGGGGGGWGGGKFPQSS